MTAMIRRGLLLSAGVLVAQPLLPSDTHASPEGGAVVAGQGNIQAPDAQNTIIHQQSHRLAIDWQTFNLDQSDVVQFNQPSSSAAVLNRVLTGSASQILGSIKANGKVFLVNGRGVYIGKNARVDVGSLFVSGLDITVADFMKGHYVFNAPVGEEGGRVVNHGLIQAATGGSASLVGGSVSNEGVIIADLGHVVMAAGKTALVDFDGDGLIRFEVDGEVVDNAEALEAAISNTGEIYANGGQVLIDARVARDIFSRAVNSEGLIRAGRIDNRGGVVRLVGLGGDVLNTGTIDVSAADVGQHGGTVSIVSDAVIEQFGTITADAGAGDGGFVELVSDDTVMARGDSRTSARSDAGGDGGEIRLLADKVGVFDNSQVDASGDTGGGTVLVGGDYQGANPEIKNATVTLVGSDASITADALLEGDGGRVILWSDERTSYHGNISVVGGEHSGDGGFVEVSSKGNLGFYGGVDVGAVRGEAGQILLDPADLTINDGIAGSGSLDTPAFDDQIITDAETDPGPPGPADAISKGAIEAITTGDITLQASNSVTLATTGVLTIMTDGTLTIESGDGGYSTSAGGTIDLTTAGGSIVIDSTAFGDGRAGLGQITTNGAGTITVIAGADAADELLANAALTTAGGAISLSGGGVVTTTSISAGGGAVSVSGGGLVTIPSISSGGGDIDLVGSAFDITGNVDSGGGAINITLAGAAQLEFTTGLPSSDVQFLRAGAGTITFGVAGGVTASDILWDQTLDLTANGTTAGAFQFLADGGVNFTAGITTDKAITVDADQIGDGAGTFAVGAAMATGGQNLDVIADNVDLTAGINAGVGNVSITTSHEDTDIHLGVAGGGGTDLDITDAELALIAATNLDLATISGATGGDIFVDAVTEASSGGILGTVTLTSVGSTISFEGAASEFSNSLNAQANNGITVSETLSTFAGNGGSITLNGNADDPAVGGSDNVVIVSSDAAVVSISADGALNISGRAIDLGESATLSGAGVTLNATNTSITLSGADATTNKNTITSTGDANTISLTGGGVVVSPNNPDLILNSQGSLVLTNINIGDGTLTVNVDTNNNGTESLTIGAGVVIGASGSAVLNGGTDDNDTLVGLGTDSVFALSATDSGTLIDGGESFGFSAFGGVDGGGGTDSLTGLSSGTSTWTIDADPTYVNGGTLDFTGIANLTGGTSTDDFTVTVVHTGDLKGGSGDDSFAINNTLTGSVDGEVGTADTLSFGSAETVTLTGSEGWLG